MGTRGSTLTAGSQWALEYGLFEANNVKIKTSSPLTVTYPGLLVTLSSLEKPTQSYLPPCELWMLATSILLLKELDKVC